MSYIYYVYIYIYVYVINTYAIFQVHIYIYIYIYESDSLWGVVFTMVYGSISILKCDFSKEFSVSDVNRLLNYFQHHLQEGKLWS